MDFSPANKMCSFCGKQGTQDTRFIGGLGAMMCVECLEHYHAQLQTPASRQALRRPPWETMTDVEVLDVLPQILRSAEQVTGFAAEWVGLLRERKISWSAIGNVLGVSRQAAWERFEGPSARRRGALGSGSLGGAC